MPLVTALAAASLLWSWSTLAKSTGQPAKTDRLDARALAHFGESVRPAIPALRDANTQALGAILARRRQVSDIIVAEKNPLGRATTETRRRIVAHIDWLEQELEDLDGDLRRRIQSSRVCREKDTCCAVVPEWDIRCRRRPWRICRSWAP